MSLITRCPACQTMFRVVQDQLRLSEGWVRCGQCDNVFDANAHFVQEPLLAATDAEPLSAPMPSTDGGPAQPDPVAEFAAQHEEGALADEALPPIDIKIDIAPPPSPEPVPREPDFDPLEAQATDSAMPQDDEPLLEPEAGAHLAGPDMADMAVHHDRPGDAPAPPRGDIALPAVEPPPPSFLRGARKMPRLSVWHRTSVRVLLSLLALVLLAGLAAQVLLQEHDRLAAAQPALKPVLASACQVLGCQLAPLKQIDSIVIDSSSFTKLRGDAYRLALVIKNNAGTELAAPAVELTLTDLQDKPVLRRVFQNSEFDTQAATLAAGGEWAATAAVSVKPATSGERISGYRVLAFYP
jgi:predicted Zn finger-like uncharacterized protein